MKHTVYLLAVPDLVHNINNVCFQIGALMEARTLYLLMLDME